METVEDQEPSQEPKLVVKEEEKGLTVQSSAKNLKENERLNIKPPRSKKSMYTSKKGKAKKKPIKAKGQPVAVLFEESAQGIWSKEED